MNPLQSEAGAKWAAFYEEASRNASRFSLANIQDAVTRLQIQSLQDRGSSVLSPEKYSRVSKLLSIALLCYKCKGMELSPPRLAWDCAFYRSTYLHQVTLEIQGVSALEVASHSCQQFVMLSMQ